MASIFNRIRGVVFGWVFKFSRFSSKPCKLPLVGLLNTFLLFNMVILPSPSLTSSITASAFGLGLDFSSCSLVTTKTDLQLHNDDFICVDKEQIIDYVTTSAHWEIRWSSFSLPRTWTVYLTTSTSLLPPDAVWYSATHDYHRPPLSTAGLAYYMGARELGMGVIRVGNGIPELQWYDSPDSSDFRKGFCSFFPYQTDRICREESYRP